jgi:hypothetical protein
LFATIENLGITHGSINMAKMFLSVIANIANIAIYFNGEITSSFSIQ